MQNTFLLYFLPGEAPPVKGHELPEKYSVLGLQVFLAYRVVAHAKGKPSNIKQDK
jgi:hypothetical protein